MTQTKEIGEKRGFLENLREKFCNCEMTWKRVIIFAVLAGVVTAVLNLIPGLKDTSFQDIAIAFECWILFAVFIIVNCKSWKEAALKCFVFFLISQPLVYLIEAPFLGWGVFSYYKYWFIVTLLTLPGAVIAYQVKRKDWLSVAVLSVANIYLAYMCVDYFKTSLARFPHHLLSSIFCLALAVFFIFVLFDKKEHRMAALAVVAATLVIVGFVAGGKSISGFELPEGDWDYTVENEAIVNLKLEDGNQVTATSGKDGTTLIIFENDKGDHLEYYATVTGGNMFIEKFTDGCWFASDSDAAAVSGGDEEAVG